MINLSKGGRVNLSKEAPGTQKFRIGLGWDANATDTGTDFDLDVSVFLCKYDAQSNPKLISDQHFVFYNSEVRTMERKDTFIQPGDDFPKRGMPASKCLGVVHSGDNRTGSGDGDDEVIFIDMTKLAADVETFLRIAPLTFADARHRLGAHAIGEYKHLLQRVDPKQLDALFEPPASGAATAAASGAAAWASTMRAASSPNRVCAEDEPAQSKGTKRQETKPNAAEERLSMGSAFCNL